MRDPLWCNRQIYNSPIRRWMKMKQYKYFKLKIAILGNQLLYNWENPAVNLIMQLIAFEHIKIACAFFAFVRILCTMQHRLQLYCFILTVSAYFYSFQDEQFIFSFRCIDFFFKKKIFCVFLLLSVFVKPKPNVYASDSSLFAKAVVVFFGFKIENISQGFVKENDQKVRIRLANTSARATFGWRRIRSMDWGER